MYKGRIIVRFLVLLSYFLPFHFLSCTNFQYAYSREELESLTAQQETISGDVAVAGSADTAFYHSPTPPPTQMVRDSGTREISYLLKLIMFPVDNGASGIGVLLFYKNTAGKFLVGTGLATIVLLLLGTRWLSRKPRLTTGLYGIVLLSLLLFAGISYSEEVDLLWGLWVSLILSLAGLALELTGKSRRFTTYRHERKDRTPV